MYLETRFFFQFCEVSGLATIPKRIIRKTIGGLSKNKSSGFHSVTFDVIHLETFCVL
jgi:hypothetical protein